MFWQRWRTSWLGTGQDRDPVDLPTQYAPTEIDGAAPTLYTPARPPDLSLPAERLFTDASLHHAWLAVKRAKGGAGVDGMTIKRFEANLDQELNLLRQELITRSYQPRPLRQVLVPKPNEGLRTLVIWALRDRIAQRVIYDLLAPLFERRFLSCSYGFRMGLGVEDAVHAVTIHRNAHRRWVVDADIRNCFDTIDTHRLMKLIRRQVRNRLILHYVQGWLDAQIMTSADGRPRRAGAAQGGVLSPLFANIYLHELDRRLTAQHLALVRYADDFVICCRRKADAHTAKEQAEFTLQRLGLQLHEQKTEIRHFDQGFRWLGYFFIRNECFRL